MLFSWCQFIKVFGVVLCVGVVLLKVYVVGQQFVLLVLLLLEFCCGQLLFLMLQCFYWLFIFGICVFVWGINGCYMGLMICVWNGDDVKFIYSNCLMENVVMIICGLQVSGLLIGGVVCMMLLNVDWVLVLFICQSVVMLWYQVNMLNWMVKQVYNGLVGMWLVEDEVSKNLLIFNYYGVDDFLVIIQDKWLDNFGMLEYSELGSGGFVGDMLLVNGVQSLYVEVLCGWVCLCLLNVFNFWCYQLQMSDG